MNPSASSVLVGVSGGADSAALIHLLHEYRERLGFSRLAIAHVNHSLRGAESDGDEEFVKSIAAALQIEFFSTRLSPLSGVESGIEEWARKERYRFFQQIKTSEKFDRIATAHTANDQAETLIMRIMRGAGIRGMRGTLPVREDGVVRPLLTVERACLEEWLKNRGLSYRVDSSNSDQKFRRNWIRSEIIPRMVRQDREAVANMALSAANAARVWEILAEKINMWVSSHVVRNNEFSFYIVKSGLSDKQIASEALITLFDEFGITVSKFHVSKVISAAELSCGEYLLPCGWSFYPSGDRILFMRRDRVEADFSCELKPEGETYCDERGLLFCSSLHEGRPRNISTDNNDVCLNICAQEELPLIFRPGRGEDRFWPLGGRGLMPLYKFLSGQGIAKKLRGNIGVVVNGRGDIVWIPGVRIAHGSRITERTERYVRIAVKAAKFFRKKIYYPR